MKKVEGEAKDVFAKMVMEVSYISPCCNEVIGTPDDYEVGEKEKHEIFIEGQEGPCPKCGAVVKSKKYVVSGEPDAKV